MFVDRLYNIDGAMKTTSPEVLLETLQKLTQVRNMSHIFWH